MNYFIHTDVLPEGWLRDRLLADANRGDEPLVLEYNRPVMAYDYSRWPVDVCSAFISSWRTLT